MGRWGVPVNVFSLCYIVFAFTMSCFPLMKQVTPLTMNWSIVVLSGVTMIGVIVYFTYGRKLYKGPVVWVKG
jgi:choline transport protein